MQLTARQVELLNSTNPQDNAELLASLGGDQQLLSKLVNMYGPGGSQFNATNYGHTSSSLGGKPDPMFWDAYKAAGIMDANGNMLKHQDNDGNWVDGSNVATFSGATVDPGQSWSGTNASGGFAGGTGTSAPYGFNSQSGAPLSAAELHAALTGTAPRPTVAGGPAPTQPAGSPAVSPRPATGGTINPTQPGGATAGGGTGTPGSVTPTPSGAAGATTGSVATGGATPAAGPAVSGNPMDYFDDAGYKFRLGEGQKAIDNTAAARGNVLSGPVIKRQTGYASDLASQEYDKAFGRMTNARDYSEGVRRYDTTLGENQRQYNLGLGENQRQFDEGTRRWGLNFDQNVATSDRDFNEGTRRFDLTTNLGQANTDRNFSYGTLKDLATLGLGASNGNSSLAQTLAQLLTTGTLAGGGALAGGTIGGANAGNSLASQILSLIFGNNLVNSLPKPAGTP